jgi:hypothetical protein
VTSNEASPLILKPARGQSSSLIPSPFVNGSTHVPPAQDQPRIGSLTISQIWRFPPTPYLAPMNLRIRNSCRQALHGRRETGPGSNRLTSAIIPTRNANAARGDAQLKPRIGRVRLGCCPPALPASAVSSATRSNRPNGASTRLSPTQWSIGPVVTPSPALCPAGPWFRPGLAGQLQVVPSRGQVLLRPPPCRSPS